MTKIKIFTEKYSLELEEDINQFLQKITLPLWILNIRIPPTIRQ